jgi:hypothetical protein
MSEDLRAYFAAEIPLPDGAERTAVIDYIVFARSDAAQLGELVARIDAMDLKIDLAQRRPLTDLLAVHNQVAAGQLPGKTILTP